MEAADLHTMVASDSEGHRLRQKNQVGIYGRQGFSRADTRLERNTIFDQPCQRRVGVDYKANVLYISRFFEAMGQGCHAR
jgi:hypothetical protein